MGFRSGIIVITTSFLLGVIFTHWIADSLTLWKSPVTDQNLWISASYYTILAREPKEFTYALVAVASVGLVTMFLSLRRARASNLMFDSGSIFLYTTCIVMYFYRTTDMIDSFGSLPSHAVGAVFPHKLRSPILELASNNLVCSVALTGVLFLQAGRVWAEKHDGDDETDATPMPKKRSSSRSKQSKAILAK